MGCCGQGRAAIRGQSTSARQQKGLPRARPGPPGFPAGSATSPVRYLRGGRVRVRGAVTGRMYEFARGQRTLVATADLPIMLRTGVFIRD
jgi:hypothetical protein